MDLSGMTTSILLSKRYPGSYAIHTVKGYMSVDNLKSLYYSLNTFHLRMAQCFGHQHINTDYINLKYYRRNQSEICAMLDTMHRILHFLSSSALPN